MAKKTPKYKQEPQPEKQPKTGAENSYGGYYPAWRISRMEMVDPFGWHKLDGTLLLQIREKLRHFESRTWNDIWVKDKHNNHSVRVEKLCADAKKRLRVVGLDDLDDLWRLRLTGKQRIWGILQQGVFLLLWWDPDHLIYPYEFPKP